MYNFFCLTCLNRQSTIITAENVARFQTLLVFRQMPENIASSHKKKHLPTSLHMTQRFLADLRAKWCYTTSDIIIYELKKMSPFEIAVSLPSRRQ